MVIFSKLPSAAQYDLENQFSRDNNMNNMNNNNNNNNKKDAKTAYRPYGYAIGKKSCHQAKSKSEHILKYVVSICLLFKLRFRQDFFLLNWAPVLSVFLEMS